MISGVHLHHFTTPYTGIVPSFRYHFKSLCTAFRQNTEPRLYVFISKEIDADLPICLQYGQSHLSQLLHAVQTQFHKEFEFRHIGAIELRPCQLAVLNDHNGLALQQILHFLAMRHQPHNQPIQHGKRNKDHQHRLASGHHHKMPHLPPRTPA